MYLPLQYASVLYHLCPNFVPCSIGSPLRLNLRRFETSPSARPRLMAICTGLSVPQMMGRNKAEIGADADAEEQRDVAHRAGVLGAEQVSRVRGVGGRQGDSRGGRHQLLLGNLTGGRLLFSRANRDVNE